MERNDLVELFEAFTLGELHQVKQLLEQYDIEYLVFDELTLQTGGAYVLGQNGARVFVNPREKREARELLIEYNLLKDQDKKTETSSVLLKVVLGVFAALAVLLVLSLVISFFGKMK